MALSHFLPRRSRNSYWDAWPQRLLNERFVRDINDWNDVFETSIISSNRKPSVERSSSSDVFDEKNKFKVKLDVSHFKPEEINVKIVDNFVIINGNHEEVKDKEGWVSRQFTRRYALPEECDLDKVTSSLTTDGILIIEAPKKVLEPLADNERIVPITVLDETTSDQK